MTPTELADDNLRRGIQEIADIARVIRANNYTRGVSLYMRVEWALALDAYLRASADRADSPKGSVAGTVPSKQSIERAICCPDGCMRDDDCWAETLHVNKDGAADAVLALLSPKGSSEPTKKAEQS